MQISNQKNASDCNFYNFSLLVPYPNNFLVVCICVLTFHFVYSPSHPQIFFLWGLNLYLIARGWENFKLLGDLGGGKAIFCHKVINDQSCKLKIVDGKIIYFMRVVYANFYHFYLGIFCL